MMIQIAGLFILVLLSVYWDIKVCKIKNFLTYPAIILGLLVNICLYGIMGLKDSIEAILIPAIFLFAFFALQMLGAGDIKLFCAIGAIMGMKFELSCLLYSFLFGGVMAVLIIIKRGNALKRFRYLYDYIKMTFIMLKIEKYQEYKEDRSGLFRFSFAILGGSVIAYLDMFIFKFGIWS
ncbi:MAG: A24 family peptidase [Bacillota bacterium]|nr:A24 family peptidase [Bacillota bacterium]